MKGMDKSIARCSLFYPFFRVGFFSFSSIFGGTGGMRFLSPTDTTITNKDIRTCIQYKFVFVWPYLQQSVNSC